MCSLVWNVWLLQGHVDFSLEWGRKFLWNSPVYAWPICHCASCPKSSRSFCSCQKWGVGFRDGGRRLDAAYWPVFGWVFHSSFHSLSMAVFECLRALARVVVNGDWLSFCVASLASLSTLSFPFMLQWLGHHDMITESDSLFSRMGLMVLWKLEAKCWADWGLGLAIASAATVLSVKNMISVMFGRFCMYSAACVAPIARAAISASYTSACPPSPILSEKTSVSLLYATACKTCSCDSWSVCVHV